MKTSSRVNHTVKEMPSRRHTKLSKGLKKSTILTSGRCWTLSNSWNQRAEQMIIEVRLSNSWPQVALIFCQKKAFMKITRGWGFSSHCSENQHKCMWPSWGCPLGQCHGISLFSPLICLWNSGEFNSRTRKVFEATVMKYRQVLDADVLLCLCKASRWRKKCKQWYKKNCAQQVVLLSGADPGAPQLSVTQICKDVITNVEGDPCHDMSSMTQVLNHATLKTYPLAFSLMWTLNTFKQS